MNLGSAQIIRGNARHLPLADDSVDLVVTSPPYFALRSYQDGGEHYAGQIGDEPTPAAFVASLLEVTAECVRVLKPSGSLWVNLGDKYSGPAPTNPGMMQTGRDGMDAARAGSMRRGGDDLRRQVRPKSLIGIPWRYALACIDDLGLILRAEVIWSKPNGLPESVTDRVRRSHEQWFHFTLSPRYFSAVDEIREPHAFPDHGQLGKNARGRKWDDHPLGEADQRGARWNVQERALNPLGKLPGSVWTVPTEPLRVPDHLGVDHFAAFPTEWPKRIIQGWSPAGVCVACGEGRRPVVANSGAYAAHRATVGNFAAKMFEENGGNPLKYEGKNRRPVDAPPTEKQITGYACACPEPTADTRPAVILDPFGGTGTTALVAKALGRHGITVDMSADYCRLATWRTNDRDQLAKVLGVAKAEQQPADQAGLFDLEPDAKPPRPSGGLAMATAKGRTCGACGYRTQRPSGCDKCGGQTA